MAEIIDKFESKKGRPPKHPWDEWADGNARTLYKGKDFEAELLSMRTQIHRKAHDLGMKAHTDINKAGQSINVWFYDED